ncbi:MAG: hypothetical protein ACYDCO_15435 [Armatimonadota bacterium]
MKVLLIAAACLLMVSAFAAESVKVTVGHVCCGGCANALVDGAKKAAWVEKVTVDGTTATVTAKAGQHIELVSLFDGMTKAGMPPKEVLISGPVTLTIGHLCCGGCANALKAALAGVDVPNFDKAGVKVDLATKTATIKPVDGKSVNLIPVLTQMEKGGFSATKIVLNGK